MSVEKIEKHLKEHPADYQSVIALYKQRSKEIEKRRRQREIEMLRKVAKYRRMRNEERTQLGRDS